MGAPELADFEPSTGHLHSCRTRATCECANDLYELCAAELDHRVWSARVMQYKRTRWWGRRRWVTVDEGWWTHAS